MKPETIVRNYIDAWNRQDVAHLLDLMHAGAAYYDAFWMESCVGRDLARYFQDAFDEVPFWYELVGDVLPTASGAVFRYRAHRRAGEGIGDPLFEGAEILSIQDGKILTVTDLYCSADTNDLLELAETTAGRHGLPSHVHAGLGAMKSAHIRNDLAASIERDHVYLDPDMTMAQLADTIGCTMDQLAIVIESRFDVRCEDFLDLQRVEHAKGLLDEKPERSADAEHVAATAGFRSAGSFEQTFLKFFGVTPSDYCAHHGSEETQGRTPDRR